jgi:hypothetical protein
MTQQSIYKGIQQVIEIQSNKTIKCPRCQNKEVPGGFDTRINHFIEHGYKILHIGPGTQQASTDGSPWHFTTCIVGT